jgi:mRNA interferase MazF
MQKGLLSKQIATVDKADLIEKIGSLSRVKIMEVIDGVKLLIEPREVY